ncbi:hypothetical protein CN1A_27 [Clavibacter phage CN1A]|uniref:Uncharacterized protein n=1 Tax=Clavibacter phage CN1A TaxID=1406793 RepID=U5PTQ6_9CAUD|nr:hypothetical protein CN1A_27 [Clavibacter phage CN1A]AGY47136.1 hypothetical protein CN1A_27 [Clavibacter phage CN1A]
MTENEEAPTIIVPGRVWHVGDPACSSALRFEMKLQRLGFTAIMGYSRFETPRRVYGPDTQKAGQEHGGEPYDNVWVEAVKPGKGKVLVSWKSKADSGKWTAYHRTCTGIVTFPIKQEEINEWMQAP